MKRITLILVSLLWSSAAQAQDCEIPAGYTNRITFLESDTLLVSFATDKEVYAPNEKIRIWFMLENIGDTVIPEMVSCNPTPRVWIYPGACKALTQPGCTPVWSGFPFCFFDPEPDPGLLPGECVGVDFAVQIIEGGSLDDGEYSVIGRFSYVCGTCTPRTQHYIPAQGVHLSIEVDPSVTPVTRVSWGSVKAMYR
jgi:hypothetical protein